MNHAIIMQKSCGGEILQNIEDKTIESGEDSKKQRSGVKRLPPNAGKGRKPGSKNKIPASVKEMILQALQNAGGAEYLERQAIENPNAFLSLVGRIIPSEISGQVRAISENLVVHIDTSDDDTEPVESPTLH